MNTCDLYMQSLVILKEIRISRHLTQEQLAQISGLNVRTIQ
ncbi:helix-turn-helix domain-containing protein [Pseudoalteromonas denitrificans]|nr:helix-turn-helix transcriptional regulator [Pseudoalteromonas denitrificans]